MVWIRGLVFTALVPWMVGVWVPLRICAGLAPRGGAWNSGWVLLAAGALVYGACLLQFLLAGGTPAIFFTRPLKWVLGEEPVRVVQGGLYRWSRNPMYVGVVLAVFGQAARFASGPAALYGGALAVVFHGVVVLVEEPHLRRERGAAYEEYCRRVPRWF